MALVRCDFFSEALSLSTSLTAILPQRTSTQIGMAGEVRTGPSPVLYLLHGLSDDDTTWVRRTSIERYAAALGLAVVMPQVQRSFYTDQAYGGAYWSFLSEELPQLVSTFFRVSERREDTFVAGLSMGGYGAFKWALREPGRFAAAASLSGALDLAGVRHVRPEDPRMFERLFGADGRPGPDDDLFALVDRADLAGLPALYACSGTEDRVIDGNRRFVEHCATRGVPIEQHFGPGEHSWAYWDEHIQNVLRWLPIS